MSYLSFVLGSETTYSADKYQSESADDADVVVCSVDDDHAAVFEHHVLHGLGETDNIEGTVHRVGDGENDADRSTKFRS